MQMVLNWENSIHIWSIEINGNFIDLFAINPVPPPDLRMLQKGAFPSKALSTDVNRQTDTTKTLPSRNLVVGGINI